MNSGDNVSIHKVSSKRSRHKSNLNEKSSSKIQAQLTYKSRVSSSIMSRLNAQEEDSSNCKSKESHELKMTLSKARTTTIFGYVSSGHLSAVSKNDVNPKPFFENSSSPIGQSGDDKNEKV